MTNQLRQLVRSVALALAFTLPAALCQLPAAQAQVTRQAVVEYVATTGAQIQTLIDRQLAGTLPRGTIVLPWQDITLTQPIIIGRFSGGSWQQAVGITIEGRGRPKIGQEDAPTSGPRLIASFTDRPAIVVQNGRAITLRSFKVSGGSNYCALPGQSWYDSSGADNFTARTTTEAWFNNSTAVSRADRYTPAACIAIDPWGSAVPGGNRIASVEALGYYAGSPGTTGWRIEDVCMQHCQVGLLIGVGTNNLSSEGEVVNCKAYGTKYGVSLCHSQVKSISISDLQFFANWGVITTNQHGERAAPLPFVDGLHGSQSNHLVEQGSGSGAGVTWRNAHVESVYRLSPAPLGGTIGAASASQVVGFTLEGFTLNWSGSDADTGPNLYAGCNLTSLRDGKIYQGGSTKKTIISTTSNSYSAGNLLGLGLRMDNVNIRGINSNNIAAASDAIGFPASHVDDWVNFVDSSVCGQAVAPNNTRLIPLNGRGL
jgi:hypothetical protein